MGGFEPYMSLLETPRGANQLRYMALGYMLSNCLYVFMPPYWRCYVPNTQAIIYVFDSSDINVTCSPTVYIFLCLRPYWRCYFPNTQAIIYVVDSSDTDRLVIAKDEFHAILEVHFTD